MNPQTSKKFSFEGKTKKDGYQSSPLSSERKLGQSVWSEESRYGLHSPVVLTALPRTRKCPVKRAEPPTSYLTVQPQRGSKCALNSSPERQLPSVITSYTDKDPRSRD